MASQRAKEGYVQIDHRNSPGISPELVREINRKSGKTFPGVPEGLNFESATRVCAHCGDTFILNPDRSRPRGSCRRCGPDAYICDKPDCNKDCLPWRKVLDTLQDNSCFNTNPNITIDMLRKTILG